jgi:hypothetical protein
MDWEKSGAGERCPTAKTIQENRAARDTPIVLPAFFAAIVLPYPGFMEAHFPFPGIGYYRTPETIEREAFPVQKCCR